MMERLVQKGKRAKRQRPMSTSSSLSSTVDGGGGGDYGFCDLGLSCGGGGGGSPQSTIVDDEDMANCLILLAQGNRPKKSQKSLPPQPLVLLDSKAIGDEFECKTCNRRFSSFQALGGHRASHKKGTTAEDFQLDKFTNTSLSLQIASKRDAYSSLNISNNKSRVHECLICGAEFGSGQALGGHMRRHRPLPVLSAAAAASKAADELLPDQQVKKSSRLELLGLDLNLPAPEDDPGRETSKFTFAAKDQVHPLVGCHY